MKQNVMIATIAMLGLQDEPSLGQQGIELTNCQHPNMSVYAGIGGMVRWHPIRVTRRPILPSSYE